MMKGVSAMLHTSPWSGEQSTIPSTVERHGTRKLCRLWIPRDTYQSRVLVIHEYRVPCSVSLVIHDVHQYYRG